MKPQLRVRTLLLPGISLLKAIGRLEKRTFSAAEQQRIAIAVLDEISYTAYAAVPGDYSHDKPPYQGLAFVKCKEFIRDVSDDDLKAIIARVRVAGFKLLHPQLLNTEEWPEIVDRVVARGTPLIFDHGVSYHWYKSYLQVRWVRPVVDYREMSVTTYFDALHSHYLKSHKGVCGMAMAGSLLTLPLNKLLTSEYEVEIL